MADLRINIVDYIRHTVHLCRIMKAISSFDSCGQDEYRFDEWYDWDKIEKQALDDLTDEVKKIMLEELEAIDGYSTTTNKPCLPES